MSSQKISSLISQAIRQHAIQQSDALELHQSITALINAAFKPPISHKSIEPLLLFSNEMLADHTIHLLCECATRSINEMLNQVQSTTNKELSDKTTDMCLTQLIDALNRTTTYLERLTETPSDSVAAEITKSMQLAVTILDTTQNRLSNISASSASEIWAHASSNGHTVSHHIQSAFEASCRLAKLSTAPDLRKQQDIKMHCASLYKVCGKTIDLATSVFSSDTTLSGDYGTKRAVLKQHCTYSLNAFRGLMAAPQLFKGAWNSLCKIAIAVDDTHMCAKIALQSCSTVKTLATQTRSQIEKIVHDEKSATAMARKVKGHLAFMRYFIFQMPGLLAKCRNEGRVIKEILGMCDMVLGSLTSRCQTVHATDEISVMIEQTVWVVARKMVVALFTSSFELISDHIDRISNVVRSKTRMRIKEVPLIPGVESPMANREILRILVSRINAFSEPQQHVLLRHDRPSLLAALALAIDQCAADTFASATRAHHVSKTESQTDYDDLVVAVAECATNVASPGLYGAWERSVFAVVLRAEGASLAARVMADSWCLVSRNYLPKPAIVSTFCGVAEVTCRGYSSIPESGRFGIRRVLEGLLDCLGPDEQINAISKVHEAAVDPTLRVRLYAVVPWPSSSTSAGAKAAAEGAAKVINEELKTISATGKCSGAPAHEMQVAIDALSGVAKFARAQNFTNLSAAIRDMAYRLLESQSPNNLNAILRLAIASSQPDLTACILSKCAKLCSSPANAVASETRILMIALCGTLVPVDHSQSNFTPDTLVRAFEVALSGAGKDWAVQHFALREVVRFAAESPDPTIAEKLVPKGMHEALLRFVEGTPGGRPPSDSTSVYARVFDMDVVAKYDEAVEEQESQAGGPDGVMRLAGELRARLAASSAGGLHGRARDEVVRLYEEIGRLI